MRNERLKQVKALIQQGPTGKFRWQTPAPGEHACERLEPFLPRLALSFAWRSQNCLFCTRNRTLGTSCKRVGPCQRGRSTLNYCLRRRLTRIFCPSLVSDFGGEIEESCLLVCHFYLAKKRADTYRYKNPYRPGVL
jgi:hypothetical protein